ncbi:hypothetical protein Pmani_039524 [Petrolisthes manimaculis]|uniref:Uncharacterized protein n=1 Tax=Petrolisthes manimaculis TaxID=1843537 RepID=A0AAE1NCP6_9EUCA|nr:hypothetical protein Pmani_039524 [Petrolisthes manimaculis]
MIQDEGTYKGWIQDVDGYKGWIQDMAGYKGWIQDMAGYKEEIVGPTTGQTGEGWGRGGVEWGGVEGARSGWK